MTSKDGFQWTEATGLKPGIPSLGVIEPPSNLDGSENFFQVIIIGAGYCGLTAARDAATSGNHCILPNPTATKPSETNVFGLTPRKGLKILLIEARDRIGGRSWSSNIGGYPFEMGGTWVHWGQPHVWREISRYQMGDQLEISYDFSRGVNQYYLASTEGVQRMSHEEEDALMDSALRKFFNIDGKLGKMIMPFPHNAMFSSEVEKYDQMSAADRIAEIQDSLTPNELLGLEAFVLLCGGGTLQTTSFFELLHWWALCGWSYEGCIESLIKYKFRGGQSSFAIRFFREASASGNLSYVFNCPIAEVKDNKDSVEVKARDGRTFKAARLVSAIPLNVLNTIAFDPPLAAMKRAAADIGHINQSIKVHAEVRDRDLRSWTGISYPHNNLIYGLGDGTTPSRNSHLVCFGAQHNHFEPDEDMAATLDALKGFTPMDIERVVFHNWSKDEFAKGAWFFSAPKFLTKYINDLRARQGNVFFANSDWAVGWRSFIDGAIEEDARAALAVKSDLCKFTY